jgi:hypothetical protein
LKVFIIVGLIEGLLVGVKDRAKGSRVGETEGEASDAIPETVNCPEQFAFEKQP